MTDTPSSLIPDDQDGSGDHQPNHGVRPLRPKCHSDGTDEHQQRRDAIRPCVDTVGFQCRRADASTDTDAVLSNHFVAKGTDRGCDHHNDEVSDLLRVDQAVNGLVASEDG